MRKATRAQMAATGQLVGKMIGVQEYKSKAMKVGNSWERMSWQEKRVSAGFG